MKLHLRDEDIVDPIDLTLVEIGIVCTGAALVVKDASLVPDGEDIGRAAPAPCVDTLSAPC